MPTLAVQLTGKATGAIAVIAVDGEAARGVVTRLAPVPRIIRLRPGQIARATLHDGDAILDDAVVVCVAENRFELHVHGGQAVVAAVLAALTRAGAAASGTIPPRTLQDEVESALVHAKTMIAARLLAAQVHAGLGALANEWQTALTQNDPAALWKRQSAAQWLLQRSRTLDLLIHGIRIAILGRPNAGKSALVNALVGRTAAITSDIPGTTRDWVDAQAVFLGPENKIAVPVTLVDTAGVRQTADPLETLAIDRAHAQAAAADLILVVLDGPHDLDGRNMADKLRRTGRPLVVAVNKMDFGPIDASAGISVSALRKLGLDTLMTAALQQLDLLHVADDEPFCFTHRQRQLLADFAVAPDPPSARELLRNLAQFL